MSAIVVNPNSNLTSVDTWALISNNIIINTILDTTLDMNSSEILNSYDYVVDLTIQGQEAGVGWTYNPEGNTFTAPPPPPIDWISTVVDDFDNIASSLLQCLSDAGSQGGALTQQQLLETYQASLEDSQDSFSPNQLALMQSIYQFILSGG